MSVHSSSPLLKMTKAPPGFRDPIYESSPVKAAAAKAIASAASVEKKVVAVAVAAPKSSVASVSAELAKMTLKQ